MKAERLCLVPHSVVANQAFPLSRQSGVNISVSRTVCRLTRSYGGKTAALHKIQQGGFFRLTSYPDARILGLYAYPRCEGTIGIAAGHAGFADPAHAHLRLAARARDRAGHPTNIAGRAARRAWRSLSRSATPGRTRVDLREVGSFCE